MPAVKCPICINNFVVDAENFAIFPCGHGFCTVCMNKLLSVARPKCPNCRVVIHRREAHPVFLDLVDSVVAFRTSVVEGLDQMGPETPLMSVKKAGQKLGKALQGARPDVNTMSALLKAVEDFKERIAPVFAKVETQKQEIDALREDLRRVRRDRESMQAKLKKAEPLQAEVNRMKTALSETERNTQEAIRLAEIAKDELGTLHVSSNQWKKRVAELDQENKRFKDMLERHANNARTQKEKNRKLSKQLAALNQRLVAEEKEPMTDATHEYDGDFSGHEQTRIHSSLHIISPSSSRSNRGTFHIENEIELDFEAMPPPRFPSDWQLDTPNTGVLKKRNLNGGMVGGHRRVANPFPIDLDRKGHPTRAVQLGPRSMLHVGR